MAQSVMSWLLKKMGVTEEAERRGDVTEKEAIGYAPIFYGIRKISTHVGMLPCNLYYRNGNTTEAQQTHPAYKLLKVRPNEYQTPSLFKQMFMTHAVLYGNGRAYVHRDSRGRVAELIPLMPDRTLTALIKGRKVHATKPERDDRFDLVSDMRRKPDEVVMVDDDQVVHLPGFSLDGVVGLSLTEYAAQSIGVGLESEEYSYTQLEKGYNGGLMLEAPVGALRKEEEARAFLESFRKTHEGADNAGKVGLLREGIKANMVTANNRDSQFAELRKFQRQDAALWLMLESILGDDASVSYNSLEQKLLGYLMNCLGPWLTTLEEEFNAKLLTDIETALGYYFKFNDGALLRSDKLATMNFVTLGLQGKVITRNEARAMFDLNPVEGGDEFENPAITPGNSADEASSNLQKPAAAIVENQVRQLIRREIRDVKNGAKQANFLNWLDPHYKHWEAKLADKFDDLGLSKSLAFAHCKESKQALLRCAEVMPEEFQQTVDDCVQNWEQRAVQIVSSEVSV